LAVRPVATPQAGLYRIGRLPDPLAWPPHEYAGDGRFDDSAREFRTLYAAEQRRACFIEALARFRPDSLTLSLYEAVRNTNESLPAGVVPTGWLQTRGVGRFTVQPANPFLDMRAIETREALHREFAQLLHTLGLRDFDVGAALSPNRELTRAIARWAFERRYQGIAYASRFDTALHCWAIFEGATIRPLGPPDLITPEDPDLRAVAATFGLAVTGSAPT
jgi:hypothetical protein